MSRKAASWLIPAFMLLVLSYLGFKDIENGTLTRAVLRPVQWVGIGALLCGFALGWFGGRRAALRLIGVVVCGIGAIMVIYL